MKYANLVANGAINNNIFNSNSRDDCNHAFVLLRNELAKKGVEINTSDLNIGRDVLFEIHIDIHDRRSFTNKKYLLFWEVNAINPNNQNKRLLKQYDQIFSWNDNWVKKNNYKKFFLPTPRYFIGNKFNSFENRSGFICMIAGNKCNRGFSFNELYSKRVETINWFEKNQPNQFELYGTDWDKPSRMISPGGGAINLLLNKLRNKFVKYEDKPFKTYCGAIANKINKLSDYKFSICYENFYGLHGYVTEKIFDCFVAGCVPVYWGSSNISDYVPSNCYIDRREFQSHEQLFEYLTSINAERYEHYQYCIKRYLESSKFNKFSPSSFSKKLISDIYI
jgi:hypothetical protein